MAKPRITDLQTEKAVSSWAVENQRRENVRILSLMQPCFTLHVVFSSSRLGLVSYCVILPSRPFDTGRIMRTLRRSRTSKHQHRRHLRKPRISNCCGWQCSELGTMEKGAHIYEGLREYAYFFRGSPVSTWWLLRLAISLSHFFSAHDGPWQLVPFLLRRCAGGSPRHYLRENRFHIRRQDVASNQRK